MSDDTLFDLEPVPPAATDAPELSRDRRRTLRQADDITRGYHPLLTTLYGYGPRSRIHPDAPASTKPGGRDLPYTCGSCVSRDTRQYHDRAYAKCWFRLEEHSGWPRVTHGPATDVRAFWPACLDYQPGDTRLSPDAARHIPDGGTP